MARTKRKGLLDRLSSPFTLVPFVLGTGSAIVLWAVTQHEERLALVLAVVGNVGALGSLLALLLFGSPTTDPEQTRRRRAMMAGLEDLIAAVPEASADGTPAPAATLDTP